ncbi:Protein of uncharacterised function (DUF2945) [Legionella busanensis]|uniref:Protein of uncharacterized function (DUF2945) n=1 Tax=Legionella busanensis TaxID=190655 RepID=A0A378JLI9_9GAMM|nr:DUF2945 domain-containing protein [Legionella busanensis]STX52074.1 Protein of uncharacterised function (DUF2945) [Legionella busanensis]
MSKLKKGDKVIWNSPQGKTKGTVEKKLTKDTKLGSKTYKASESNPKLKVKSTKSGKEAIHKEDSVKKNK